MSQLGRTTAALNAITDSVNLILPALEQRWHALPDSGAGLAQRYVTCCGDAGEKPDEALLERLNAVLRDGGVVYDTDVGL